MPPEFVPNFSLDAQFELYLPVTRVDAVAQALRVFDRYWRLSMGLASFGQLSEPEPPFRDLDALILSPEFARLLLVDASIGRRGCASCPCATELNAALRDRLEEIDVDIVSRRLRLAAP